MNAAPRRLKGDRRHSASHWDRRAWHWHHLAPWLLGIVLIELAVIIVLQYA